MERDVIATCALGFLRDCNCAPEECRYCGWNPIEARRRIRRLRAGDMDEVKPGLRGLYVAARPVHTTVNWNYGL